MEQDEACNDVSRVINIPVHHENQSATFIPIHSSAHSDSNGLDSVTAVSDPIPVSLSTEDFNEQLMNSLKTVDELKNRINMEQAEWNKERQALMKSVEEVMNFGTMIKSLNVTFIVCDSACY
jgi:hypothetical protein